MNESNDEMSYWIKPNDVMQSRKLRAKRQALTARLNNPKPLQNIVVDKDKKSPFKGKRRNPFGCPQVNTNSPKLNSENDFVEDSALEKKSNITENEFSKYLRLLPESYSFVKDTAEKSWTKLLNVDWSLKSQVRICSPKPFHWKHTFKTSEEASGTTGFVRCLNSEAEGEDKRTLDTSPNAQFFQRCLLWQHPSLPLVKLFPRYQEKLSAQTGMFGSDPQVASSLHKEWSESLRSLYQLLRVRQCPFFYVCCHSFTCLFRAAGAAGFPHTHALITPTTRGLRSAMKREGVEFSMPIHKASRGNEETAPEEEKDESEEEPNEILETLGLETSQFPSLNQSRSKTERKKYRNIDNTPESLVYVEDMELQGLINFILNCGSCVSNTGSLAGVPPTLLSPVGFHGGTLKSLKIYGGTVRTSRGDTQYCFDVQGPILPSTVLYLSTLLSSSSDSFSLTLSPISSTIPFSSLSPSVIGSSMSMAFASEGLVDCGLSQALRQVICKSSDELMESGLPCAYKEITFENGLYSWA